MRLPLVALLVLVASPWSVPVAAQSRGGLAVPRRAAPPLMPWQRSLEDALALVEASAKPLLVCVNMDGEPASESMAWGRYRDPEFAALAEGFVCVLASPSRHRDRERDDRGRRLVDPRFGRLLDAEHIDVEPVLYERYFQGRRVAPRHLGVAPDGEILFDLFLLQDLSRVDDALRAHGKPSATRSPAQLLSEEALLASPDARDREELERRFLAGDQASRLRLAGLALSSSRRTQHPELLRLGLLDPHGEVRRAAAGGIAEHVQHAPLELIPAAWDAAGAQVRASLVTGLARRARVAAENDGDEAGSASRFSELALLTRVFSDLFAGSAFASSLPTAREAGFAGSSSASRAREAPEPDLDVLGAELEALEREAAAHPDDRERWVRVAAVRMRLARLALAEGRNPSYFCIDARDACDRALALRPGDARALGLKAWASHLLSDLDQARALAARALPELAHDGESELTLEVVRIFASLTTRTIYAALEAQEDWPAGALTDAIAGHELAVSHANCEEADWVAYLQLLGSARAHGLQASVVRRAVRRFPDSGILHAWLRFQVLRDAGARALEAAYLELGQDGTPALAATHDWFGGLAALVAAERDVQNGEPGAALGAYRRSLESFHRSVEKQPEFGASAAHYQCLAQVGAARIQAESGAWGEAVDSLLGGLRRAPGSFGRPDGLERSPKDSVRELRRSLSRAGESELAAKLEAGLAELGLSTG